MLTRRWKMDKVPPTSWLDLVLAVVLLAVVLAGS